MDNVATHSTHSPGRRRHHRRLLIGAVSAVVLAAAASVALTGTANAEADRTVTSNTTGTHNGYFFSYWKDNGNVNMTLGAGGCTASSGPAAPTTPSSARAGSPAPTTP